MYYNKSKQRKTYENAFCDYSRHRPTCELVYLAIFAVFAMTAVDTSKSELKERSNKQVNCFQFDT